MSRLVVFPPPSPPAIKRLNLAEVLEIRIKESHLPGNSIWDCLSLDEIVEYMIKDMSK